MVIFYVTYDAQQSNMNFGQSLRDTYILIDVHEKRYSRKCCMRRKVHFITYSPIEE